MASLKQAYQQDTDTEDIEMVSDDTLFTVYNPKFIEDKKQMIEDYIETYKDDLQHYNKLKEELKQAEQKLEEHNNSYLLNQRNLSHYIDRLTRENNIQPTEYMGTINSRKPFYI